MADPEIRENPRREGRNLAQHKPSVVCGSPWSCRRFIFGSIVMAKTWCLAGTAFAPDRCTHSPLGRCISQQDRKMAEDELRQNSGHKKRDVAQYKCRAVQRPSWPSRRFVFGATINGEAPSVGARSRTDGKPNSALVRAISQDSRRMASMELGRHP